MSRKKKRRITKKDYYRMKGIKPEDAEKDDYLPLIFKPRLAVIPMFLAVAVWLWRLFWGPELEFSIDWTFGIVLFIGLSQVAILECRKERFLQWGVGMVYLLTAVLLARCFWVILIFSAGIFFVFSVVPATELWKEGKKTQALLVGVLIFVLSGSVFMVSGGVCMYRGGQAILFPYTAESVEKIVFRQNGRNLQIDSPKEIARIVEAWDMYFFLKRTRPYRGAQPYSLEGRPQWHCTIYRKDGGRQEFLLALGLNRQSQSFYVETIDPPEWFNPFGMAQTFQCPKLYPVLQPILEQNPYHNQSQSKEIIVDYLWHKAEKTQIISENTINRAADLLRYADYSIDGIAI